MGCSKYVGRVGMLAATLGVGLALATISSPIADAAPSDSGSAKSSGTAHVRPGKHATPSGATHKSGAVRVATPAQVSGTLTHVATGLADRLGQLLKHGPQVPPPPSPAVFAAVADEVRRGLNQAFTPKTAAVTPVTPSVVMSDNLLVNPGAEVGDPSLSAYSAVSMPGWTITGTPTVIKYGTLRNLPGLFGTLGPTLPRIFGFPQTAVPDGGNQFFGGGNVATSSLTQVVDLSSIQNEIDTTPGGVAYDLSGFLGGYLLDPSRTTVKVNFLDTNNAYISSAQIGPVTALDRLLQTGFKQRDTSGVIPVGTRSAQVVVTFSDCNPILSNYNNAYADNLSFTVGASVPAPAPPDPPASNVGSLDHVIMVYMENHGVGDIVGSPNAPYINSLINSYGYAQNYYALTHPSDPNYYPILGGSDFGTHYNCAANCFDEPNIADELVAAGKSWAAYQNGGGGYSTPTDRTPFLAFHDIYTNEALVNSQIRDISQMATDFQDPSSVADFVWFAADEATNMEGPISTLPGIAHFAFSQLTTHQYNVKAGDQFIQEQMSTIFNSDLWSSNESTAVFLTFDEDYNNISFGIGNEGNHVVMVVIPNQAAIDAGMQGGAFVATDHYNHYSLQRTIEESLGIAPLTNNDKYAQPLNEFWT
ncbi:phosphoesterase [Mycobacterium sp. CVI_P3]|uniref:Phosphoesterase n=1 Tax=Mycobacterium pinniadriaticum TaxID=2994102 RepID=A0ABT3SQB1_9MYCO|nr:alkaline phosphatase family protein [Mycobacterium pinniadriaticum]MCX2934963.1 phosphoesterase [Mycobacterium pinniadriaticum]MCX2941379.1 phosphoesterase [Mycobacterium pinniadriaticum]